MAECFLTDAGGVVVATGTAVATVFDPMLAACDDRRMDNALEISPLLYLDADGSLSLGPEAEVEDQGDTIVISRGRVLPGENFPHQFYAGPDARLVRSPDGKCWAQVPILRRLAALPRGEKLSIDDFDATEGAPIPGLVPPGGRAAMVGGRAGDFHFGSSPTP